MKQRSFFIGFIIVILCFLLVGCGQDQNKNQKKQVTIEEDFVALTEIKNNQKNIYVIVKSMSSSYWKVILEGCKNAGEDMHCNIYAAGCDYENQWQMQQAYVERAIEKNADGIILGPVDSIKMGPITKKAYDAGIPVMIVDTMVYTDGYNLCYMTDNLLAGQIAAKEMIRQLKEVGFTKDHHVNVAIQIGSEGSQTVNERLAGFCEYWTKYAPEYWTILDQILINNGNEELSKKQSIQFFQKNRNIQGVFGTDNCSTVGFSTAIMETQNRQTVIIGFDYSPQAQTLMDDENVHISVLVQKQYDMGYFSVKSIFDIHNGEETPLKFYDTGVVVLNRANKDTEEMKAIIH